MSEAGKESEADLETKEVSQGKAVGKGSEEEEGLNQGKAVGKGSEEEDSEI